MRIVLKVLIVNLVMLALALPLVFSQTKEEESFYIAAKAFSDNFYGASLSLFERFTQDYPQSPLRWEAQLYAAKCHYQKEDYPKALEVLLQLSRQKGLDIIDEVYYWLGTVYLKGKDFEKAQVYLEKVVEDCPGSEFKWQANSLYAQSSLELGRVEQALSLFEKIIEESRQEQAVDNAYSHLLDSCLQNKKYSSILSLGRKYLKSFPRGKLKAKAQFYLGEAYSAQGKKNKALNCYQQALKLNHDRSMEDIIHQSMGFNYLEDGDKISAKASIDKIRDKQTRLFSQGVYYFRTSDYIQALEVFNIFIRDYPQSPFLADVYLSKADLLYEMGRLNDSIYIYRDILNNFDARKFSDITNKAHYGLAWCYLKSGKFKEAIEEFESTLEYAQSPAVKVSSKIQIADAYQETDKYSRALDIYNDILKDHPNTIYADYIQFQIGMAYLKQKDLSKAFLTLKNLKNNFPSSKLIPQAQYYLAVGYFSRGDYAQAKKLLEEFVNKYSQDELMPKAYYLYGKCFFNAKDYVRALSIFEDAAKKYKDKEVQELAHIDIAATYLNLSLFDKAKATWEDFLKKFPRSQYEGFAALSLGGLYEKDNNYIEARKYYKRVIRDYEDSSWAQEAGLSLGHLYWGKGDLFKAKECFEKIARSSSPISLKAKFYLAKVLAQEGKSQKALELYGRLAESAPAVSKAALLEQGFLFKEMKEYGKAVDVFKKAIEQGADTVEAIFSLGLCLEKTGRDKEAIEEYFKAIYASGQPQAQGLDSYKVKAYFRIAKIYEKEDDIKSAKEIYRKIIDSGIQEAKIAKMRLGELDKK